MRDTPEPCEPGRTVAHVYLDSIAAADATDPSSSVSVGVAMGQLADLTIDSLIDERGALQLHPHELFDGLGLIVQHLVALLVSNTDMTVDEIVTSCRGLLDGHPDD